MFADRWNGVGGYYRKTSDALTSGDYAEAFQTAVLKAGSSYDQNSCIV